MSADKKVPTTTVEEDGACENDVNVPEGKTIREVLFSKNPPKKKGDIGKVNMWPLIMKRNVIFYSDAISGSSRAWQELLST